MGVVIVVVEVVEVIELSYIIDNSCSGRVRGSYD